MRQLVFQAAGQIGWQEAPDPVPADPHGAVVAPLAVARCDLDLPMAAWGIFPGPFPVGHELVAEVVAVGEQVRERAVGERVMVPFEVSCGACETCRAGRFAACTVYRARAGAAFGFGEAGGGHGGAVADLLGVPHADHMLLAAPKGLAPATLCTIPDNVVDGYRGVAPALAERPGADVLIVGGVAPSIGLYAVAAAVALGAGTVVYIDSDPERLNAAQSLGATVEHHEGEWPRRFDRAQITVNNTPDAAGLSCVLRSTADYGICTSVAIQFVTESSVPLLEMYTRGVTFHTSRADSRRFLPEVLKLVADGRLDPTRIPTTIVPWDRAPEAWLAPATKLVLDRS